MSIRRHMGLVTLALVSLCTLLFMCCAPALTGVRMRPKQEAVVDATPVPTHVPDEVPSAGPGTSSDSQPSTMMMMARKTQDPGQVLTTLKRAYTDRHLDSESIGIRGQWIDAPLEALQEAESSRILDKRENAPSASLKAALLAAADADEIWVIRKYRSKKNEAEPSDVPGSGELRAKQPGETKEVVLPLKHTDVNAAVAGYIATVNVTQQYTNPYSEKIEAVYVFPLPENAAVNEFVMTVGERKIRGIIREREEAEKIYTEARSQGYVASLLTQERPNIFTQSVANIEPGKAIDINITYFNTLAYVDGAYEFVFPMVVGPRFNPPGSTDGVGAVAHGQSGISGQKTEVQYLKPTERSGHDIGLKLTIDAGVSIEKIQSVNHVVQVGRSGDSRAEVALSPLDAIPNKDFVLRYQVAGDAIKSGMVTHKDERGTFFTMMLFPPADLKTLKRAPVELVFVLDCSGSMNGQPIAQAKAAVERALRNMQPDDTFQVIRFSNNASQLGDKPIEATAGNVRRGLEYLKSLEGQGGTMMIEGIKAALDFPHDPRRLRYVVFLTDGFIGNEAQILVAIHERLGESRIFSFGVGSSVNRYLLDGMASVGRGAVAYLSLNDSAAEVMDTFFSRISHPAMTDLAIDWGGLQVEDVFPARLHDLFVGRPITITGRLKSERAATVRVRGKAGETRVEVAIPVAAKSETHPGLAAVWARMKIATLAAHETIEPQGDWGMAIKQTALDFNLMSAYTAFVAVDSTQRTSGDHGTTVAIPVPVPDGVRYETTVQE